MERFLLAHSTQSNWQLAIDECLQQLGTLPADAGLSFIYVTDHHASHLTKILQTLKQSTNIEDWTGTVGMGVCCSAHEYMQQPAIVLLVTDLQPHQYTLFSAVDELHGMTEEDMDLHVAVVHGDPRNGQLAEMITRLPEQIGNGYLIGGLTSSNNYYYQVAGELAEGGLSGAVLNQNVNLITGLSQGCSPLGDIHQVTECDGNIVMSIDNQPALDIMKSEIGEVLARDLQKVAGYIFVGFPIPESDTGDYLVRNLIGLDPDSGAIAIGEYLQHNTSMMFCRRDTDSAVTDLQNMVSKLKQRGGDKIKGGLYFSCLGRGENMFGEPDREMRIIEGILGDVPLVGFYANGEIAANRLYGYTGVLTLFL